MFGQYRSALAYMLVANILTKRIHDAWVRWSEDHEDGKAEPVKPLMITIEEAHKFLSRDSATIFGTIAREMRKYLVTLMVIDQRPSGIDDEVMSQLGTRITAYKSGSRLSNWAARSNRDIIDSNGLSSLISRMSST